MVQWLYRPADVDAQVKRDLDPRPGEWELFYSVHTDPIVIASVIDKLDVKFGTLEDLVAKRQIDRGTQDDMERFVCFREYEHTSRKVVRLAKTKADAMQSELDANDAKELDRARRRRALSRSSRSAAQPLSKGPSAAAETAAPKLASAAAAASEAEPSSLLPADKRAAPAPKRVRDTPSVSRFSMRVGPQHQVVLPERFVGVAFDLAELDADEVPTLMCSPALPPSPPQPAASSTGIARGDVVATRLTDGSFAWVRAVAAVDAQQQLLRAIPFDLAWPREPSDKASFAEDGRHVVAVAAGSLAQSAECDDEAALARAAGARTTTSRSPAAVLASWTESELDRFLLDLAAQRRDAPASDFVRVRAVATRLLHRSAAEAVELYCALAGRLGCAATGHVACRFCLNNQGELVACARASLCGNACCRACFKRQRDHSAAFAWYDDGRKDADAFDEARSGLWLCQECASKNAAPARELAVALVPPCDGYQPARYLPWRHTAGQQRPAHVLKVIDALKHAASSEPADVFSSVVAALVDVDKSKCSSAAEAAAQLRKAMQSASPSTKQALRGVVSRSIRDLMDAPDA